MNPISLEKEIEKLTIQYFGYSPMNFFRRVSEKQEVGEVSTLQLSFFLAQLDGVVCDFEKQVNRENEELKAEVRKLRKLLNVNPSNSSKPPSADRYQKIKNSREKTGRQAGGQIGHKGCAHELHEVVDVIHRYDIYKCIECGGSLKGVPEHEVVRKQTIEILDGKTHVTEYQTVIKFCPNCGRWNRAIEPKNNPKARITFGPNVRAIAIYFVVQHLLPFWRVQEILYDLFGVTVSQGSICNFLRDVGEKLKDWEVMVVRALLSSPLMHVDETGIRCKKRNDWVHVLSNNQWTLLTYHESRGQEAIEDIGILPEYKGHLVHDAFSAYWNYGATHSLCNAHILRELKYLAEEESQKWAIVMANFLKTTLHELHNGQKINKEWKKSIHKKFIMILRKGYRENGYAREWKGRPPDGYKYKWDMGKRVKVPIFKQRCHSKAMNLLNRLRDHESEVLAFALKPDIPFTNNQAERDFRLVKLKEKISGCFRSVEMARSFLRIRSYLNTLRKQQLHCLENLVLADICLC